MAGLGDGLVDGRVAGVQPLDTAVGRRPTAAPPPAATAEPARTSASITRLLFPDRQPDLPDEVHVNGEPMDLAYVVGVLLANRDLERRLAAENAGERAAVA